MKKNLKWGPICHTHLPKEEILCVKNEGAFVVCVFLIKEMYAENVKKNSGSRLGATC